MDKTGIEVNGGNELVMLALGREKMMALLHMIPLFFTAPQSHLLQWRSKGKNKKERSGVGSEERNIIEREMREEGNAKKS